MKTREAGEQTDNKVAGAAPSMRLIEAGLGTAYIATASSTMPGNTHGHPVECLLDVHPQAGVYI
jgi:hypothetical protein